uniref:F-box protein At1g30790-like n=1 Tax=Erigeron canadensis TaxID=72917 RepID=UPI001CB96767|nr:F-box protein At1g30790-like [Erigeron canadensis]
MGLEETEEDNTRPVSIPHELISEILTRLPVKSLARFQSVSTQWDSTITHPSFCISHLTHSASRASTTLILTFINRFTSDRNIFSVSIPPNGNGSGVNPTRVLTIPGFAHPFVSQSLNGLICLNMGSMCVCNPSTRKFVKLPWTQTEVADKRCLQPQVAPIRHRANAFGFDPVTNAHKVLDTWITCHDNDENGIIIEQRVFTIGTGCDKWRRIAEGPSYFPFNESVCINGKIYFRAYPSMIASEKPVMVVFDVHSEEFQFIQMNDDLISDSEDTVLMEHDGHLAIVDHQGVTNGEVNAIQMRVLIDEKDGKWVKKCVKIPEKHSEMKDRQRFIFTGTTFTGEMIFAERKLVNPFHVFFYDIKKNEAKKVKICGLTEFDFSYSNVLMNVTSVNEHVESIKSLT